jgi:hypothetical protein
VARRAATGWSISNFLSRDGLIRDGENMLFTAWVHTISTATQTVLSQGQSGSISHRRFMATPGTPRTRTSSVQVASGTVNTTGLMSQTTWQAMASAFVSSTERHAYINGGSKVSNTTSVVPGVPNQIRLGINNATLLPWNNLGAIADVAVWDTTGMSGAEIDSLVALVHTLVSGFAPNPLVVNAQSGQPWEDTLLAYWPLDFNDASPWNDQSGNAHHLTMNGTLTEFASFAPVNVPGISANISGTIIGQEPRLDFDMVDSAHTIIISLVNDTWVAAGATFDAQRQNIIDGLVSAASPTNGWNNDSRPGLVVSNVVRTNSLDVTITVPTNASYALTDTQDTITVTVPATAVVGNAAIVGSPTIAIHPVLPAVKKATTGWNKPTVQDPIGDFLEGPAFITGSGFLVSQWVYVPVHVKCMPWQLGRVGTLSHHWRTIIPAEGTLAVGSWWNPTGEEGDPGFDALLDHTGDQAQTTDTVMNDRWVHLGAAWVTDALRYAWLYGDMTTEAVSTAVATPLPPDCTRIGVRVDDSDSFQVVDETAEVSVWDINGMTLAQIRSLVQTISTLSNGLAPNPRAMNATEGEPWEGKLLSYPDLDFTSATWLNDLSGNHVAYTEHGTLTEGTWYPPVASFEDEEPEPPAASGSGHKLLMLAGGL